MLKLAVVVVHVIACLLLILFILLHAGRGSGVSDMFGGSGSQSLGGGSTVVERNLDRITIVTAVVAFVTTIVLVSLLAEG